MEEILADSRKRKHSRSTAGLQFEQVCFNIFNFTHFQVEILVYCDIKLLPLFIAWERKRWRSSTNRSRVLRFGKPDKRGSSSPYEDYEGERDIKKMPWLESLEDGELEICQNSCVFYTKK